MSDKTITLTFGTKDYVIRPMTVRQLLRLENCLTSKEASTPIGLVEGILAAALSRDHADVVVGDLEATADALYAMMQQVLDLAGFVQPVALAAVEPTAA